MPEAGRVPVGVDPSKPNAARVFNYLLGGKDNYEVDQMVAHRMLAVDPATRTLAWFSRQFLLHGVRMAAEQGIRQFIDIGAGIPITPDVHEVAREIEPAARVVSIDYDPVVHAHANALLAGTPGVTSMLADVRAPVEMIVRLRSDHAIDFSQPVAVLIVGVLHFVMDDEDPYGIIARFRDVMAPGSLLVYTQAGSTTAPEFMARTGMDTDNSPAQVAYRTQEQAARFLDGFEVVGPGVTPIQQWLGDDLPETKLVLFGGIGRKPEDP
ncbi:SAM-dependent methyltransferase [Nocardia sp. 2]|uniref:SAM-dependent methyltransferase n=1 Tax=Nocardia acididurans TaxID=2802282 RepID=A0ABS1M1Z3_9NOCA|nr:SAM-dependent methyltransferase [Nocardia acididurans]MBL1074677.1 SAM-dependent methyltransferase [Nocardia acididurans]